MGSLETEMSEHLLWTQSDSAEMPRWHDFIVASVAYPASDTVRSIWGAYSQVMFTQGHTE